MRRGSRPHSERRCRRASTAAHTTGARTSRPTAIVAALQSKSQFTFLALTTSAALRFAAYGGFVVLDKAKSVVAVQAVGAGDELTFGGPLDWRDEFTAQLRDAGRLVPVTLPASQTRAPGATRVTPSPRPPRRLP